MTPAKVEQDVMRFQSILADGDRPEAAAGEPECFSDLNLDLVVETLASWPRYKEYDLKPLYHAGPVNPRTILYRHEVMRDLQRGQARRAIEVFAERMRTMRGRLAAAGNRSYAYEKERWFLEAADVYVQAVEELSAAFADAQPRSSGLCSFAAYLAAYVASDSFQALRRETGRVKALLDSVGYNLLIDGDVITVQPRGAEPDYTTEVEAVFAKFKQGAVKDYRSKFPSYSGLNHVENMVLARVARRNPEAFAALDAFCAAHGGYIDRRIADFDREIHFYVAYLDYMRELERAGLSFCFPKVSDREKEARCNDAFDLALAWKLVRENAAVVCNDFELGAGERILVVTGPNQGGKSTFARMVGQLHWLAGLGLPVPGTEARLTHFDRIFTHFERVEDPAALRGKLHDDLVRMHRVLEGATPRSVIVINEIFGSTSVKDALDLSRKILERVSELDALCVCVTFLDELSTLNEKTASYVAGVRPEDPTLRTFRIRRRTADGKAYALAIAEKHGLTYRQLKERLGS